VVTGEIGYFKHEIAYLGNTVNTPARIEEACRELQRPFLASADKLDAVESERAVLLAAGNSGPASGS
jgi:adenylate cyclase